MIHFFRTSQFDAWLSRLRDPKAKGRILHRVRSAERGNFGDCNAIGHGVIEMRVHSGPGYRVYLICRSRNVYLLLCGGTKRTQKSDIRRALALAELLKRIDREHDKAH